MWNSTWVRGFSVRGRVQEIFKDMKRLSIFEFFCLTHGIWRGRTSSIFEISSYLLIGALTTQSGALVVEKSLFGSCWPNPPLQIKEAIQKAFQKLLHKSILIKLQKKTWHDMTSVNFEVLFFFGGMTRLDSQHSTCANLNFFFNKKKLPNSQNPKVPWWRPFYGLRCGSQRDLRRHFGAQWRAERCSGSGKRTEVGKLKDLSKRIGLGSWKKGEFVGKGTKNRTKPPIFGGFPILVFWRMFSMWAVKKEQFFIGYWLSLSLSFVWRVNITRNRWVQWNVTYIFFHWMMWMWKCLKLLAGVAWGRVVGFSQVLTFTPTPSHISKVHDVSPKLMTIFSTNYQSAVTKPQRTL